MSQKAERPGLGLLGILLSAVGIAPLLTYGMSATSDLIIRELQISETQFGLLATVCFGCAAIGNAAFSRFSDRRSDLTLLLLIFALASAAMLLAALPAGYVVLLVASGLAGLSQSFPNGVTNRVLAQRVPAKQRIGWTGIKQSGVQVSQLVGSVGFPMLASIIGWHGASLAGAILAALIGVAAVRVLTRTPVLADTASTPKISASARAPKPNSTKFIVFALTLFGFINGVGVQATNVYIPLFAVRELNFSLVAGGLTAAVVGVVGVSARVGWGHMMSRGVAAPKLLLLLAALAALGGSAFLTADLHSSQIMLWTAVVLHGASALGVSVVLMTALLQAIPVTEMASASGIVSAGQFGGFTVGPLAMGMLIETPAGFTAGWLTVIGIYACCIILGIFLVLRGRKKA